MTQKPSQQPIGIYDSGIGGLTVAHAIAQFLPHEDIVYFGDTAHLPYGEKSEAAIQSYSIKIADFLLQKQCKTIVVACHSASSACYHVLPQYVGNNTPIINVIDPMINCIKQKYCGKHIGLIGTKRTILSKVYSKEFSTVEGHVKVAPLATPLLAPMIEEGFFNNQISHEIIRQYLSSPVLEGIECLALACTHYPIIKHEIGLFYNNNIPILDSSEAIASATVDYLKENELLNTIAHAPSRHFFVSDYTPSFEACAHLFFGDTVHLEQCKL